MSTVRRHCILLLSYPHQSKNVPSCHQLDAKQEQEEDPMTAVTMVRYTEITIIVVENPFPADKLVNDTNYECHLLVNSRFELFRKQDTKILVIFRRKFQSNCKTNKSIVKDNDIQSLFRLIIIAALVSFLIHIISFDSTVYPCISLFSSWVE